MTRYYLAPYVVIDDKVGLHFTGVIGIQGMTNVPPDNSIIFDHIRQTYKSGTVEIIAVFRVSKREYTKYE